MQLPNFDVRVLQSCALRLDNLAPESRNLFDVTKTGRNKFNLCEMVGMPISSTMGVHLVRVTTDDREHRLWVAMGTAESAVSLVLDAIPEGWTASLLSERLTPPEVEALDLKPGEASEIRRTIRTT
jgi:hypothetical protein